MKHKGSTIYDLEGGAEENSKIDLFFSQEGLLKFISFTGGHLNFFLVKGL